MSPEFEPHMLMVWRIGGASRDAVAEANLPYVVAGGGSVRFAPGFTPMPDVIVFTPSGKRGPANGANVMLVVEVGDSTREDDLDDKRRDYAKAGLPEYWVADIPKRMIHRFSAPADGDYTRTVRIREADEVVSDTLPGLSIRVLFP